MTLTERLQKAGIAQEDYKILCEAKIFIVHKWLRQVKNFALGI